MTEADLGAGLLFSWMCYPFFVTAFLWLHREEVKEQEVQMEILRRERDMWERLYHDEIWSKEEHMKRITHSPSTGTVYYGTVAKDGTSFTKIEEIDEEYFKISMINFIRHREKGYSEDGALIKVKGRLFKVTAIELDDNQ